MDTLDTRWGALDALLTTLGQAQDETADFLGTFLAGDESPACSEGISVFRALRALDKQVRALLDEVEQGQTRAEALAKDEAQAAGAWLDPEFQF